MVVWEKFRNNNSTFLVFFYKLTPKCSMVVWVRSETTTLHVWFIFVKKNTKCSMVVWKTSETTITFLVSFCNFKPQRSMAVWERTKQQFYILRFLKPIQKENAKCRMVVREIYNRNNNPTFLVFFLQVQVQAPKCSMVVWEKFRNNNSTFWGF